MMVWAFFCCAQKTHSAQDQIRLLSHICISMLYIQPNKVRVASVVSRHLKHYEKIVRLLVSLMGKKFLTIKSTGKSDQ